MSTQIITVPLTKLAAWEGNVRKTDVSSGLDELASSIAAHGLLQPLVVRKGKRGKHAVIAGARRLAALQLLASDRRIDPDFEVPCTLREDSADDREISLAENVIRAPMHPADQYEAFASIIADGASVTDVAARFGVSETTVEKRLKLGRLSPVILKAYRDGDLDLEEAMAFTLSDDHKAQKRLFKEMAGRHISPQAIRKALTQGEIPATDKRAKFIGLEAYEAAGGTIRRDLFDTENAGYLQDAALLDSLVADKLRGLEPEIKAEGWAWTLVLPDATYDDTAHFRRSYPETLPLPDDLQAELDRLQSEYDAFEQTDSDNESADEDAIYARMSAIEERIEEIEQSAPEAWTQDQLSVAGALITLGRDGMPDIHRGMVRPEDERAAKAAERAVAGKQGVDKPKPAFAASLMQELTARRTAALTACLMERPDVAIAALVHGFAGRIFFGGRTKSCLHVTVRATQAAASYPKGETDKALCLIEGAKEWWARKLPAKADDLWPWCLAQDRDTLTGLLAFCVAQSVDAIVRKVSPYGVAPSLAQAQRLADAISLDMSRWFTATPENYLMRVSRNQIAQAYREAKGQDVPPAWLKLKKADMAKRVAEGLSGTGWLPEPLRPTDLSAIEAGPSDEEESFADDDDASNDNLSSTDGDDVIEDVAMTVQAAE